MKNKFSLVRGVVCMSALTFAFCNAYASTNYMVQFDNTLRFTPAVINIQVGDSITWADASSGIPHTVTGLGAEPMCGTADFSSVGAGCSHTFMTNGSFAYHCNFHFSEGMTGLVNVASVVVPPPNISISSPQSNAVFSAPANVTITANATGNGSTVTNVTFLDSGLALGSATNSPFTFVASNLVAGTYPLSAIAFAGGVSATSSVVTISVINPVPITTTTPSVSNGQFSFFYSAAPGLSYVVSDSQDLTTWTALSTNVASNNPVQFNDTFDPSSLRFYRVGQLPNP